MSVIILQPIHRNIPEDLKLFMRNDVVNTIKHGLSVIIAYIIIIIITYYYLKLTTHYI
jgi:hypothetical protein